MPTKLMIFLHHIAPKAQHNNYLIILKISTFLLINVIFRYIFLSQYIQEYCTWHSSGMLPDPQQIKKRLIHQTVYNCIL